MKPEAVIAWHRTSDLAKAVHLLRQQGMTLSFPMRSTFAHQALELIPDLRSKHLSGFDQAGFLGMCPGIGAHHTLDPRRDTNPLAELPAESNL